jgi:hypothetical protein
MFLDDGRIAVSIPESTVRFLCVLSFRDLLDGCFCPGTRPPIGGNILVELATLSKMPYKVVCNHCLPGFFFWFFFGGGGQNCPEE